MATESIFTLRQHGTPPQQFKYFYVIRNYGSAIEVSFMYGESSPTAWYSSQLSEIQATIEFTVQPDTCISTTLTIYYSIDSLQNPHIRVDNNAMYEIDGGFFYPEDIGCSNAERFNQDINLLNGSQGTVDGKPYTTIVENYI